MMGLAHCDDGSLVHMLYSLWQILEEGDPLAEVALGVLSLQDEPELVGHLTVSVQLQ